MPWIELQKINYTYTLRRQKRKTLSLQLTAPQTLEICVPLTFEEQLLPALLQKKAGWLAKQNEQLLRQSTPAPDIFFYLGQRLQLKITRSKRKPDVTLSENALLVNLYTGDPTTAEELLRRWYYRQASLLLKEKTQDWAKKLGVSIKKITLKDQKTRWGSCSSLGNINYNWRIIMAPPEVITYLVLHETAHRVHLNHSAAFWQLVGRHQPDYLLQKQWLKEHGALLFKIL